MRISISVEVWLRLVQVCPAVFPQFFTSWANQAQNATYAHAFVLSFFVTIENKRLVNPTPKREVAHWNRVRELYRISLIASLSTACFYVEPL